MPDQWVVASRAFASVGRGPSAQGPCHEDCEILAEAPCWPGMRQPDRPYVDREASSTPAGPGGNADRRGWRDGQLPGGQGAYHRSRHGGETSRRAGPTSFVQGRMATHLAADGIPGRAIFLYKGTTVRDGPNVAKSAGAIAANAKPRPPGRGSRTPVPPPALPLGTPPGRPANGRAADLVQDVLGHQSAASRPSAIILPRAFAAGCGPSLVNRWAHSPGAGILPPLPLTTALSPPGAEWFLEQFDDQEEAEYRQHLLRQTLRRPSARVLPTLWAWRS